MPRRRFDVPHQTYPADGASRSDAAPQNAVPESDKLPWKRSSDASHSSVMLRLWNCATSLHGPHRSGATAFDRREIRVGEPAAGVAVLTAVGVIGYQLVRSASLTAAGSHSILANLNRDLPSERSHRPAFRSNPRTPFASPVAAAGARATVRRTKVSDAVVASCISGLRVDTARPQQADEPPGWRFRLPDVVPTQPW